MGFFADINKIQIKRQWVKGRVSNYGLNEERIQQLRRLKLWMRGIFLFILLLAGVWYEFRTSFLQASFLPNYAKKLTYSVAPGSSPNIVFPKQGPFNKRRGYTRIPEFQRMLESENYTVTEQASFSPELVKMAKQGMMPPYREAPVTGLIIRDAGGAPIYEAKVRRTRVFDTYEDIPPLIVKSLLFIEDRELNNPIVPSRNPVINWNRFIVAGLLYGASKVGLPVRIEGGSTLATQLEKYRYSPKGRTYSGVDKLKQMAAATLKVYKHGSDTRTARHEIILDYINTMPLAAVPGHGEIYGMGHGLYSWFGLNLWELSQSLASDGADPLKSLRFKQALTLLCAVRGPTYYIMVNRAALEKRVSNYITLLEKEGIVSTEFASVLQKTKVVFSSPEYPSEPVSFSIRKAVNAVRKDMAYTLDVPNYYNLDHLDLEVDTTINTALQKEVAEMFNKLKKPEFLKESGLKVNKLLAKGDPEKVIYSFLLYEKTPHGNVLRVHADNYKEAFDINDGMKLILGSTAKLRTLVHYLEIVERLHRECSVLDAKALKKLSRRHHDPISRWAARIIRKQKDTSVESLLEKAMKRSYSGDPEEKFFTGGGIHKFKNYRSSDDNRVITVEEATIRSVNLIYIRLMRDIVRFHKARLPYEINKVLADQKNPQRRQLLEEIADDEAKLHLRRYYNLYRKLSSDAILSRILRKRIRSARRLAIVFFAWNSGAGEEELAEWFKKRKIKVSSKRIKRLFLAYGSPRVNLSDYGFLLKKHPLDVWCAGELIRNPGTSWGKVLGKSPQARRTSSAWLLRSSMRKQQNIRLRIRAEKDAFVKITAYWRTVGFPFKRLVPSFSTSIGSSADQPAALAKLIGIILNDGVLQPDISVQKLRFANSTPYHTFFELSPKPGQRVMAAPVAMSLRGMLKKVVDMGTGRRAKGVFTMPDGTVMATGGKTGTGDNQHKKTDREGNIISSKALNRTATFAFYIGDRYFGVITAFVSGSETKDYNFTSALPVSILKLLAPAINSHLASKMESETISESAS
ncbi:MAG: glycosyl transferase family 51 [Desulfobacteraceae bacterium]|nr:glycosyl transferase family 51 [Desulfobacteraceae bacterium]